MSVNFSGSFSADPDAVKRTDMNTFAAIMNAKQAKNADIEALGGSLRYKKMAPVTSNDEFILVTSPVMAKAGPLKRDYGNLKFNLPERKERTPEAFIADAIEGAKDFEAALAEGATIQEGKKPVHYKFVSPRVIANADSLQHYKAAKAAFIARQPELDALPEGTGLKMLKDGSIRIQMALPEQYKVLGMTVPMHKTFHEKLTPQPE